MVTEGKLALPDPTGPVRIPDRRVIAQARVPFEVRLDNAGPHGTGVLTGDGVVRYERFSDRPAAAPNRGTPTRRTGATTAMNKPEPGTTSTNSSNDSAVEGPVRWAGVDWSWSEHAVCVIDDAGAAIAHLVDTGTTWASTSVSTHEFAFYRLASDRIVEVWGDLDHRRLLKESGQQPS